MARIIILSEYPNDKKTFYMIKEHHCLFRKLKTHGVMYHAELEQECKFNTYIVFYQGGPIYHCTHFPGPVSQSSAESEYNAFCTAVVYLAHFRMLNS